MIESYKTPSFGIGGQNQGICAPNALKQKPQIEIEIEQLNNAIQRYSTEVDVLASRLSPLVSMEPPTAVGPGAEQMDVVPLAGLIRRAKDQVNETTDRICSLIRRLEV